MHVVLHPPVFAVGKQGRHSEVLVALVILEVSLWVLHVSYLNGLYVQEVSFGSESAVLLNLLIVPYFAVLSLGFWNLSINLLFFLDSGPGDSFLDRFEVFFDPADPGHCPKVKTVSAPLFYPYEGLSVLVQIDDGFFYKLAEDVLFPSSDLPHFVLNFRGNFLVIRPLFQRLFFVQDAAEVVQALRVSPHVGHLAIDFVRYFLLHQPLNKLVGRYPLCAVRRWS